MYHPPTSSVDSPTMSFQLDTARLKASQGKFDEAVMLTEQTIQTIQSTLSQVKQCVSAITQSNHALLQDLLQSPTLQASLNLPFQTHPSASPYSGMTFLQIAIQVSNEWAVWQLLKKRADPNITFNGRLPLALAMHLPASGTQIAICNMLIISGVTMQPDLFVQMQAMANKTPFIAMRIRSSNREIATFPVTAKLTNQEIHDFFLQTNQAIVSEFETVLALSSLGIADSVFKQCRTKTIEGIFKILFGVEKIRPVLEIIQLAIVGASHLKEKFKGFYITDSINGKFFFEEFLNHPQPNLYINLHYKNNGFDAIHCVRQSTLFAVREIYQNPDYLPYYPWDEEAKAAFQKICYALRAHPIKTQATSLSELFFQQRWYDLLPSLAQILTSKGGQVFLESTYPSLMAFYNKFIEDCEQHSRYLRFKHALFSHDEAANQPCAAASPSANVAAACVPFLPPHSLSASLIPAPITLQQSLLDAQKLLRELKLKTPSSSINSTASTARNSRVPSFSGSTPEELPSSSTRQLTPSSTSSGEAITPFPPVYPPKILDSRKL